MRRTVRRRREPADDDELDSRRREYGEKALEVRHGAVVFTREPRTASANRRAAIIFRTRSVGGQPQVLTEQGAIDVLLVDLDRRDPEVDRPRAA